MVQSREETMKAITLRNLPSELVEAVRKEAERNRTSVNKAVISLLEQKTEAHKKSAFASRSMTILIRWRAPGQKKRPLSLITPWHFNEPSIGSCGSNADPVGYLGLFCIHERPSQDSRRRSTQRRYLSQFGLRRR